MVRSLLVRAGLFLVLLGGATAVWADRDSGARQLGNLELLQVAHAPHGAIVRLLTRRRVVALSWDDGPDARFTLPALRIMRRYGAHATFFLVGRAALAHRGLVRAELRNGHELANHTFDHADLRRLGPASTRLQLSRGHAALLRAGAPAPVLFRAPYGNFTSAAARQAAREHEVMAAWSVTIERALNGRSVRHAVAWLMRRIGPGSIILAHDGRLNRARTLLALPLLLGELHRRGYQVVSVSSLLRIGGRETRAVLRRLGAVLGPT